MAHPAETRRRRGRIRAHWLALTLLLLTLGLLPGLAGVTSRAPSAVVRADDGRSALDVPAGHVALVVDGAPGPATGQVLDTLERLHVPATFAVVGARVDEHPEVVRRMLAEGHEVAVATFTGTDPADLPRWRARLEVDQTQLALAAATGRTTALLGPLGGVDGESLPNGGAGAVVHVHTDAEDDARTARAVERTVKELRSRGYVFDTVTSAIGARAAWRPATTTQVAGGRVVDLALMLARGLAGLLGLVVVAIAALTVLRTAFLLVLAGLHAYGQWRQGPATWLTRDLPPVSVVVPARDAAQVIGETLTALVSSHYPALEVVVVDDGSADATAECVDALGLAGVRVVSRPGAGTAAAIATGIAQTRHPVVVLVDAGTVVEPDALAALVDPLLDPVDGPATGAVAGDARIANRSRLLGRWQHLDRAAGPSLDRRAFDLLRCVPTVPGALGAFRREALDAVGGVSGDTLAERTDLTMLVTRAGWRVAYAPGARARTAVPTTWGGLWRRRYLEVHGTLQSMWKHRRAVRESGPAGRLGRVGLPYLLAFQVLLPLLAPAIDVAALYALLLDPAPWVLEAWLGILAVQTLSAAVALQLDDEPLRALWSLPLQQLVFRQLTYLVVLQSVASAVSGVRVRWTAVQRPEERGAVPVEA